MAATTRSWHQPIRVAEQVAMVDLLSHGRVLPGLGRGTAIHEHEGLNSDPACCVGAQVRAGAAGWLTGHGLRDLEPGQPHPGSTGNGAVGTDAERVFEVAPEIFDVFATDAEA
jgi:hypothetical protein